MNTNQANKAAPERRFRFSAKDRDGVCHHHEIQAADFGWAFRSAHQIAAKLYGTLPDFVAEVPNAAK